MKWGQGFYLTNDVENAQKCYDAAHRMALELCQKTGEDATLETGALWAKKLLWETYEKIGGMQLETGNCAQAENYYMRAWSFAMSVEEELRTPESMGAVVECQRKLAGTKLLVNDSFMAAAFLADAVDRAETIAGTAETYKAKRMLAECYCQYAACLVREKRIAEAEDCLAKARRLTEALKALCQNPAVEILDSGIDEGLGDIALASGDPQQARKHYEASKKILEALSLKDGPLLVYERLAESYFKLGQTGEDSLLYLCRALDIYEILLVPLPLSRRLYTGAVCVVECLFRLCGQAAPYDLRAVSSENYAVALACAYEALAEAYELCEKDDQAEGYVKRAIGIREKTAKRAGGSGEEKALAALYQKLSAIYERKGDFVHAREARNKSLHILLLCFGQITGRRLPPGENFERRTENEKGTEKTR